MLTCERLTWRVGRSTILDGCGLHIPDGGICALLGPSGSGKTSILRAIMGLNCPQEGLIDLDGTALSTDGRLMVPPERRPIAFLFQNFTLFPHLDVGRNITIGIKRLPPPERKERLREVVDLLGIGHLIKRGIHDLSGGEQQRVALARTLALRPRVLLLDEPFSNLDRMTKHELYHEVRRLIRDRGMTAVLATHDQEEAFFFADQMVLLRDGEVVADDSPSALYNHPTSEWVARFTGAANCLSASAWEACFGRPAPGPGLWMIRPEQVRVQPDTAGPATVVDLAYYGATTRIDCRCEDGSTIIALHAGSSDVSLTDRVALAPLADPAPLEPE